MIRPVRVLLSRSGALGGLQPKMKRLTRLFGTDGGNSSEADDWDAMRGGAVITKQVPDQELTEQLREKWRKYPPTKPQPPEDDNCCASGSCCPCIFDAYYEECRLYKLYGQFLQEEPNQAGSAV